MEQEWKVDEEMIETVSGMLSDELEGSIDDGIALECVLEFLGTLVMAGSPPELSDANMKKIRGALRAFGEDVQTALCLQISMNRREVRGHILMLSMLLPGQNQDIEIIEAETRIKIINSAMIATVGASYFGERWGKICDIVLEAKEELRKLPAWPLVEEPARKLWAHPNFQPILL